MFHFCFFRFKDQIQCCAGRAPYVVSILFVTDFCAHPILYSINMQCLHTLFNFRGEGRDWLKVTRVQEYEQQGSAAATCNHMFLYFAVSAVTKMDSLTLESSDFKYLVAVGSWTRHSVSETYFPLLYPQGGHSVFWGYLILTQSFKHLVHQLLGELHSASGTILISPFIRGEVGGGACIFALWKLC